MTSLLSDLTLADLLFAFVFISCVVGGLAWRNDRHAVPPVSRRCMNRLRLSELERERRERL